MRRLVGKHPVRFSTRVSPQAAVLRDGGNPCARILLISPRAAAQQDGRAHRSHGTRVGAGGGDHARPVLSVRNESHLTEPDSGLHSSYSINLIHSV